jgi:phage terminase large subunit-like protein
MEHDDSGDLLARLALVSVARQNGKSVIVRALNGWLLDEGYKIPAFKAWDFSLLAAHDAKQARIPYDYIRRDLVKHAGVGWKERTLAVGRQVQRATLFSGIEYNGVRIDVASAREGSARGISPGLICFDEVLTQNSFAMYEVLSPAQSAIRNALMLMTSTMGFADSVVLRQFYDKLVRQIPNL